MLKSAISTLLQHRLRTAFTALGIALSVALFLCLSTLSILFSSQVEDISETYRIDIAVQSAASMQPLSSRVDPEVATELADYAEVEAIILLSLDRLRLPWNPYTLMIGISELEPFLDFLVLLDGTVPAHGQDGILIGQQTAMQGYSPGQVFMLREDIGFPISGVFASRIPFLNGAIVLPLVAAQAVSGHDDFVSMLMIRLADGADPIEVMDRINERFPELRATPAGGLGREGVIVESANKLMILITFLSFAASAMLMSNTLIMSTVERASEFGILFAVGWSKLDVTRMVLLESLLIAALGFGLGLLLALGIMAGLTVSDFGGASWWISPNIPLLSILVSGSVIALLAITGTAYPIFLATRRTTIDALRTE